jgi:hypothetical protein
MVIDRLEPFYSLFASFIRLHTACIRRSQAKAVARARDVTVGAGGRPSSGASQKRDANHCVAPAREGVAEIAGTAQTPPAAGLFPGQKGVPETSETPETSRTADGSACTDPYDVDRLSFSAGRGLKVSATATAARPTANEPM